MYQTETLICVTVSLRQLIRRVFMRVYKIEGAKNSFALVSFLNELVVPDSQTEKGREVLSSLAAQICSDERILMDGCVFVFPSEDLDFSWEFFNSDGSEALMCGNAARAVSMWYHAYVKPKKEIAYKTPAQIVNAQIISHGIWTNTKDGKSEELAEAQVRVWLKGAKFVAEDNGYQIYDSGVPHLCVFLNTESDWSLDFKKVGSLYFEKAKSLRYPKALDKKGSNVTYVWGVDPKISDSDSKKFQNIKAMSFERGVEGWTEACGTGAIAAAYFIKDTFKQDLPIHVQMPGGVLEINELDGKTSLTGPAKVLEVVELDTSEWKIKE